MSSTKDFSKIPFYSSGIITEDNIGLFLPEIPDNTPMHDAAMKLAEYNGRADFLLYDSKRHRVMKFLSKYFEYIPVVVFVLFAFLYNVLTAIIMMLGCIAILLGITFGITYSIKKEMRQAPSDEFGEIQEYAKKHVYTIGEYQEKTGRNFDSLSKNAKIRFRVFQDDKMYFCVILEEA